MADILTIVVTFNGMKWIERCMGSLTSSIVPTDIVIIDNGSNDGTPEWIEENHPEARLVRNSDNSGFAAANNIGFRIALEEGYSYIYLLNQDAWIFPETFTALTRSFGGEHRTKAGIISPMQMTANVSKMDTQFKKHCGKLLSSNNDELVPVPFVMASHWMISKECLAAVGGFSPAFPHYGEDNNFIDRARFHGFTAAVSKTAIAVHDRNCRPRPKEYRMNLKNINARVAVADPNANPFFTLIGQTFKLLAMGALHFSVIPWRGIAAMWASFGELKEVRKTSRKGGVFLD